MSEFYRIASVSTGVSCTICFKCSKWPYKKCHKGLSPVNELAIKLVNYDLLKKPLTSGGS
ncbi:unnamed protein product [Tenebrio molitor]|nr:unnamed protein product [Tenebrio molitor]